MAADEYEHTRSELFQKRWTRPLGIGVIVIMSLNAVLTAWTAFQSSVWNGVQQDDLTDAEVLRDDAVRLANTADKQLTIDVGIFTSWIEADAYGQPALADYLAERFRDEFRVAFDAWEATDPEGNPDAPPTPFQMEEYQLASEQQSNATRAAALDLFEEADEAGTNADLYVGISILFAVSLFFGAVAERWSDFEGQVAMSGMALLGFLVAVGLMLSFPISFG